MELVESLKWFDNSHYFASHDHSYWRAMILDRIAYKDDFESKRWSERVTKNRLLNIFQQTKLQAENYDSPEANLHRSITISDSLPAATIMRLEDLNYLTKWATTNEKYKSDLEGIERFWGKWGSRLSDVRMHIKKPKPKGNKITEWKIAESKRKKSLTDYDAWENTWKTQGFYPMMINLHKSEEEILSAIRAAKKASIDPKRFLKDQSKEFDKWHKYGVLPYFDLKIWCKVMQKRLTNEQIGTLIWPTSNRRYSHLNREERIKKQTIPFCRKVISRPTLLSL